MSGNLIAIAARAIFACSDATSLNLALRNLHSGRTVIEIEYLLRFEAGTAATLQLTGVSPIYSAPPIYLLQRHSFAAPGWRHSGSGHRLRFAAVHALPPDKRDLLPREGAGALGADQLPAGCVSTQTIKPPCDCKWAAFISNRAVVSRIAPYVIDVSRSISSISLTALRIVVLSHSFAVGEMAEMEELYVSRGMSVEDAKAAVSAPILRQRRPHQLTLLLYCLIFRQIVYA